MERAAESAELLDATRLRAMISFSEWDSMVNNSAADSFTWEGSVYGVKKRRTLDYMCVDRLTASRVVAARQAPSALPLLQRTMQA